MIEILVYPADEVKKEIDGLMDNFKEMELQKDEKIEQLKKEKEWLINHYILSKDFVYECTARQAETELLSEMQQALKEGK